MSKYRAKYEPIARQAAAQAGIDPEIFVRQINQESGFNPSAKSGAGAIGIAQIVPKWHPNVDPNDPVASLNYAAQMNARNLKTYGGDWAKTLAAYNAGAGAVAKAGGVPNFPETQNYVKTILGGTNVQSTGQMSGGGSAKASSPFQQTQNFDVPPVSEPFFKAEPVNLPTSPNGINYNGAPPSGQKLLDNSTSDASIFDQMQQYSQTPVSPTSPAPQAAPDPFQAQLIQELLNAPPPQPKVPIGGGDNFFGDVLQNAQSLYDPNVQPTNSAAGFIGQVGGKSILPLALGGLGLLTGPAAPVVSPALAGLGGVITENVAGRTNDVRNNEETTFMKGLGRTLTGATAALAPVGASSTLGAIGKNALVSGGVGLGSYGLTQATEGKPFDLGDAAMATGQSAALGGLFGAFHGRGNPKLPDPVPLDSPKLLPGQITDPSRLLMGGFDAPQTKALPGQITDPRFMLPGGVETPLPGGGVIPQPSPIEMPGIPLPDSQGMMMPGQGRTQVFPENIPAPPRQLPGDVPLPSNRMLGTSEIQTVGANPGILEPNMGRTVFPEQPIVDNSFLLPETSSFGQPEPPIKNPARLLETNLTEPLPHGTAQTELPGGGVLERPEGAGVLLKNMGKTEFPEGVVVPKELRKALDENGAPLPKPGESVPVVPAKPIEPTATTTTVPNNRVNSLVNRMVVDNFLDPEDIVVTGTGKQSTLTVQPKQLAPEIEALRQQYQAKAAVDPMVDKQALYRQFQAEKRTIVQGDSLTPVEGGLKPAELKKQVATAKLAEKEAAKLAKTEALAEKPLAPPVKEVAPNQVVEPQTAAQVITEGQQAAIPGQPESGVIGNQQSGNPESGSRPVLSEKPPRGFELADETVLDDHYMSEPHVVDYGGKSYSVNMRQNIDALSKAIGHNELYPDSPMSVSGGYIANLKGRSSNSSLNEFVNQTFTPQRFITGRHGLAVEGVNASGKPYIGYLDAHVPARSGMVGDIQVNEPGSGSFHRSVEQRAKAVKSDDLHNLNQKVAHLTELMPNHKGIKRLTKMMEKNDFAGVMQEIGRLHTSGDLDKAMKQIEPVVGKC